MSSPKSVCILGSKGFIANPQELNGSEFLAKCGQNTGNLLFQYATAKLFGFHASHIGVDIPYRHDAVNGKFDYLILPCANFINPSFDLSGLANYLEKVKIPIIPIGLGVQSPSLESSEFSYNDLHESVKKMLEIFKRQSPVMFLRGSRTYEVLISFGFSPDLLVVSGCPSNFISKQSTMEAGFSQRGQIENSSKTILITGDEIWPKDKLKRDLENKLIELLRRADGIYLVQSVEALVSELLDRNGRKVSDELVIILRHLGFQGTNDELSRYFRIYHSIDSWMMGIRSTCFSTGLRLHGNMCSLQSGIPSVWIYHDLRTRELCESMDLPSMSISDAFKSLDANEFIQVSSDVFEKNIQQYFITRNYLCNQVRLSLSRLGIMVEHSIDS
jgi:hypothetical protein